MDHFDALIESTESGPYRSSANKRRAGNGMRAMNVTGFEPDSSLDDVFTFASDTIANVLHAVVMSGYMKEWDGHEARVLLDHAYTGWVGDQEDEPVPYFTEKLRRDVGYDPDGEATLDQLIAYKDALEDLVNDIDRVASSNALDRISGADAMGYIFNRGLGELPESVVAG